MTKYIVGIREVHVSYREVEANSIEEALEIAPGSLGDDERLEYSHTLDTDTWSVEEEKENGKWEIVY